VNQVVDTLTSETLVRVGFHGRVHPGLAESWTESPDGLTWRFKIRRGVTFRNGTPLTARTVVKSLQSALRSRLSSGFPVMADVESVSAPSAQEIELHLRQRSTFIFEDLESIISGGRETNGAGPFILTKKSPTQAVLHANAHYYAGRPAIDRIVITPYATLRTAWADMMRGQVDFLYEVGSDALSFVRESNNVRVFPVHRPYAYVVLLNQRVTALRSPLVRKALNAGVDRGKLVQAALDGHGTPEDTPVWPDNWAYDPNAPRFHYRPEQAIRWLEQAGLHMKPNPDPDAGPPARLRLGCLVPTGFSTAERVGLVLQQQLRQLGVDLQLQAVPPDKFIARVTSGDFQAAIIDFIGGYGMTPPYWEWHSRPAGSRIGFNFGDYRDRAVDTALDSVRHAPNDQAYREGVSEFERSINEDPPAIFLAWSETFRAVSDRFVVPSTSEDQDIRYSIRFWKPAATVEFASR